MSTFDLSPLAACESEFPKEQISREHWILKTFLRFTCVWLTGVVHVFVNIYYVFLFSIIPTILYFNKTF